MATSNHIKRKNLGGLQTLLLRACPPDEEGRTSIPMLAKAMGQSPQSIYRWLERQRVPQGQVLGLLAVANGRVKQEELHPYVFREATRK